MASMHSITRRRFVHGMVGVGLAAPVAIRRVALASETAATLGKGKAFYFRPGHETFSVYLQKEPLQVVENAVRRLGS